ncbi:hypothetical protein GGF31_001415 [Allomyces arbusculus]|nr:hypothetical protein GGF31_001415 [Allomyces arbusculus]
MTSWMRLGPAAGHPLARRWTRSGLAWRSLATPPRASPAPLIRPPRCSEPVGPRPTPWPRGTAAPVARPLLATSLRRFLATTVADPPPPPPPIYDQHDRDDAHAVPEYDPNRDPDSAEAAERLLHAQDTHVARIKSLLEERGIHPVLESPDVYIAQTYDEAELLAQLFDHDEFVGLDTKLMPTHYLGVDHAGVRVTNEDPATLSAAAALRDPSLAVPPDLLAGADWSLLAHDGVARGRGMPTAPNLRPTALIQIASHHSCVLFQVRRILLQPPHAFPPRLRKLLRRRNLAKYGALLSRASNELSYSYGVFPAGTRDLQDVCATAGLNPIDAPFDELRMLYRGPTWAVRALPGSTRTPTGSRAVPYDAQNQHHRDDAAHARPAAPMGRVPRGWWDWDERHPDPHWVRLAADEAFLRYLVALRLYEHGLVAHKFPVRLPTPKHDYVELGKLVIKYATAFQRERFPGLTNPPAPLLPVRQLVAILANRYAYWRVVYKESIRRRRLLMAISALAHDGRVLSLVATDHEQAPIVDPKTVEFKSLLGMCVRVNVDADEPAVWEGLAENLARKPRPIKPAAESSATEPTLDLTSNVAAASTDASAPAPAPAPASASTDAPLPPSPVSSVTTAPTSASPMVTLDLADAAMQSPSPSPMDVAGADEDGALLAAVVDPSDMFDTAPFRAAFVARLADLFHRKLRAAYPLLCVNPTRLHPFAATTTMAAVEAMARSFTPVAQLPLAARAKDQLVAYMVRQLVLNGAIAQDPGDPALVAIVADSVTPTTSERPPCSADLAAVIAEGLKRTSVARTARAIRADALAATLVSGTPLVRWVRQQGGAGVVTGTDTWLDRDAALDLAAWAIEGLVAHGYATEFTTDSGRKLVQLHLDAPKAIPAATTAGAPPPSVLQAPIPPSLVPLTADLRAEWHASILAGFQRDLALITDPRSHELASCTTALARAFPHLGEIRLSALDNWLRNTFPVAREMPRFLATRPPRGTTSDSTPSRADGDVVLTTVQVLRLVDALVRAHVLVPTMARGVYVVSHPGTPVVPRAYVFPDMAFLDSTVIPALATLAAHSTAAAKLRAVPPWGSKHARNHQVDGPARAPGITPAEMRAVIKQLVVDGRFKRPAMRDAGERMVKEAVEWTVWALKARGVVELEPMVHVHDARVKIEAERMERRAGGKVRGGGGGGGGGWRTGKGESSRSRGPRVASTDAADADPPTSS